MRQNKSLAKTPINGIPIGEVVQDDHGHLILRIKKPGCDIYETVTIEQLLTIIFESAQPVA